MTFTNFEPNLVLVNINKLKPYKFIEFEIQDFEVQMLIYWEKPQTTKQSQKGLKMIIKQLKTKMV